ncbi:MAG: DUF1266 domain-containing protein [Candidatus Accumulibacter sp.]|jgi:hypothetical protein|nr:DUF1266 domain-containing protein [Accumulibacter sp.]
MIFSFFRELKDAVMEGVAEAREELAQEAAKEEVAKAALARTLDEKTAQLSPEEIFVVLLGAPLREIFVDDAARAKRDNRKPYYSLSMEVHEDCLEEMAGYLKRDFDVEDRATLRERFSEVESCIVSLVFGETLDDAIGREGCGENDDADENTLRGALRRMKNLLPDGKELSSSKPLLALWMARFSYLATVSAALGYIDRDTVYDWMSAIVSLGFPLFDSWEDYAESYRQGEKEDGTNTILGRTFINKKTDWLLKVPESPWFLYPWPKELPKRLAAA